MSYLHIENLYQDQTVLMFREVYAMEKIHGTSAHISWRDGNLHLSPGGVSIKIFEPIFNLEELRSRFLALGHAQVTIFGEAYGGPCQKMRETYGNALRFVAFEAKVGDYWLDVPNAESVALKLGLEFVHYERVPATIEALNDRRDMDSVQAIRNGCGPGRKREGIVIRPLLELTRNNGERVIAKHKRAEFGETRTPREVNPQKQKVLDDAKAIALEWVTDMRLSHVVDKLRMDGVLPGIEKTGAVIAAMIEDVEREGRGEIITSKEARQAIGTRTAILFKGLLAKSVVMP